MLHRNQAPDVVTDQEVNQLGRKEQLIGELNAAYGRFVNTIADLDERTFEEKWLDGRWGAREIVAHHTGWLGQLAGGMERMARGEKPTEDGVDWNNTQYWNDLFAERAKGKQKQGILDELSHALDSFKAAAEKLPEERFEEGKTVDKMFDGAGIGHFKESAEMVQEWRGQHASP